MDYHKTYDYFYKKAQDVSKRMIMAEMQKAKLKNRPFSTLHNKIIEDLHDYIQINFTNDLKLNFNESHSIFQNKHTYYSGTENEIVKWILEDEINKAFKKNQVSSYSSFIADLAVETSLKVALNHFNNYSGYYQLVYDLDKYEYFVFKYFEGIAYESSIFYKNMMDEKYPKKAIEREKRLKISASHKSPGKEGENVLEKTISVEEEDILELLNSFTDKEKYLLIHVINKLIRKPTTIPVTDLMKLVRIVGTYEDLDIFIKNSNNVTAYSKVSKGVGYYKEEKQLKIIDSTILKLSTFNIEVVNHQLLNLRIKHLQDKENIRKPK
ncbi:hypothetical protein DFQ10_1086 [Winogradskyella eximia]|uniref:Uncharacterized protein n=1 Tax=Winogradskyella eximia TaxID=262006 RepID=A0A3D9GZB2_9FLAO|nr:hypothetical protein [Winogradskyella eximia]RED42600.1 hypothetical protein DFQ10_1086 [Winogradskyella eximia]